MASSHRCDARRREAPHVPPRPGDDGFREMYGEPPPLDAGGDATISITMITRCRPSFLREALRSIARQSYAMGAVEVLVVDDSPSDDGDGVRDFLRGTRLEGRLRWIRCDEQRRLGAKRNAAVRRARGDLVFVWDDDDYFSPSRLETQAAALADGGAVLLGADEPGMAFYFDAADGAFREASGSSFAQPCSMAFRRELWGDATYGEDLDVFEDLHFFEALLFAGVKVATTHVPWVRTRHAANVVRDARGDGAEGVVDAADVARACDLPDATLAFLRSLGGS